MRGHGVAAIACGLGYQSFESVTEAGGKDSEFIRNHVRGSNVLCSQKDRTPVSLMTTRNSDDSCDRFPES